MQTLDAIHRQIEGLKDTYIFWTQKEIRALPETLEDNERILAVTSGFMDGVTWLAVCTDRRVIFLNRGMIFGLQQTQMALDRIQSIDHETTLIFANMRIWDGASAMVLRFSLNQPVKNFVKVTREAMDAFRRNNNYTAPAPAASDLASQLERLAALKEKGVLTEEEFQAQKKKLLG